MFLNEATKSKLLTTRDDEKGVLDTVRIMSAMVRHGKIKIAVRELALKIVSGLQQKNFYGEANLIHKFVRDNIRYVRDIVNVETVQTPEKTIEYGQGDCDDKSVLAASLLESIGHKTRFIAVGFSPGNFCHVLLETKIGKKWIAVETTEPVAFGWSPPGVRNKMIFHNKGR